MNRVLYFYILTIFYVFTPSSSISQVTIGPEIGVSYLPFTILPYTIWEPNPIAKSNRLDLLLGIAAEVPIHRKWKAKINITYVNREDVKWTETLEFPTIYLHKELKRWNLNLDLNLRYNLHKKIFVGMGPSLIKSFRELNDFERYDEENVRSRRASINYFGMNSEISIDVNKRISINLKYLRLFKHRVFKEKNRLDFTIFYRFGKM